MDPTTIPPDPFYVRWLHAFTGFLSALVLALIGVLYKRHMSETDRKAAETKTHLQKDDDRLAGIESRLAVLEDRPAYVTLPELEVAIERAISKVRDVFTPQHESLSREVQTKIAESERHTQDLVSECNGALRRDFNGSLERLQKEMTGALSQSAEAVSQATAALRQSSELTQRVLESLERHGLDRRRKKR